MNFPLQGRVTADRLYTEHQPWLLQRLHARLQHREDAEDLAAETFVQALQQPDLAAIREPRAFLTTVAKRLLFHFWRRRDLERAYLEALASHSELLTPSAEEQHLMLESLHCIDQALDGLPAQAKLAFLYSQLDGMSYRDISATLGISVMTVRRHIGRAIERCCTAI
ncbi:sigma-70 family RNA polymerase sigma factor [Frateuria aurantia]